jgi:hypothetical protein
MKKKANNNAYKKKASDALIHSAVKQHKRSVAFEKEWDLMIEKVCSLASSD